MLPAKFQHNLNNLTGGDVVWKILKMATVTAIFDIRTERLYHFWISMSPRSSHQLSVQSVVQSVRKTLSFEECQDGCHGSSLRYRNATILAIWIYMSPKCLPPSFRSVWHCSGDVETLKLLRQTDERRYVRWTNVETTDRQRTANHGTSWPKLQVSKLYNK